MGHTYVIVKVYDLSLSSCREVKLMVDTGSTYTWVSKELLSKLRIKPDRKRDFRTIEGKIIKRLAGMGIVECMNERAPTIFVFAEEGDAEVLGVHALEGLGLEVDPTTKELRKVKAVLAMQAALRYRKKTCR
ncbi:MAG: aspartyl protease family protein [Candidatus Bathyarchaeia archaeon]